MKSVSALVLIVVTVFLAAPPASAYLVTLDTWNTTQINGTGDHIDVTISGSTIEFKYVAGATPPGTAKNMLDIFWDFSSPVSTSNTDSYTIGPVVANATDGFNGSHGYGPYVVDAGNPGGSTILDVTFTFASALPTTLVANDFVVHVQYTNGCSGFVGGTGDGGGPSTGSNGSCTPVPEPMTMFLGGTGLLVMGYVARKRLFVMGRSLAV